MKSITAKDGKPVKIPITGKWYEECCDCALTHRVLHKVYKDGKEIKGARIEATFWRADKETEEARKGVKLLFVRKRRPRRLDDRPS